jgi:hypothetical protein
MQKPQSKASNSTMTKYAELVDSVHVIINSKGGVGKSCVASILADYFYTIGLPLSCIDADPTVKTFSTYKIFQASRIKNLVSNNVINERAFDGFVEKVAKDHGKVIVVDTGGSGFVPFMNYMIEGDVLSELRDCGKKIFYHTPIVSKQAQQESIAGLDAVISQVPDFVNMVLWLNEYNGEITEDGNPFMKSKTYARYESRLYGVMKLAKLTEKTFGQDMGQMLENHMAFSEALESDEFAHMAKVRLRKIRKIIYASLDTVFGCDTSVILKQA